MEDGKMSRAEQRAFDEIAAAAEAEAHGKKPRQRLAPVRIAHRAIDATADWLEKKLWQSSESKLAARRTASVLGVAALVFTAGRIGFQAHQDGPSPADVRAAAFSDVDVLRATGTCAPELQMQADLLAVKRSRGSSFDLVTHPDAFSYYNAIKRAEVNSIPCLPLNDARAMATVAIGGRKVMVTGGESVDLNGDGDAVPLLDFGTDVADLCNGVGPLADEDRNPAIGQEAAQFAKLAVMYCAEPTPGR